jgi:asparagine synthase (glutamine-hydrolysing)
MYDFLDARAVRSLVESHLTGKVNRRLLVWSLLCFDQWCRTFLLGEEPH